MARAARRQPAPAGRAAVAPPNDAVPDWVLAGGDPRHPDVIRAQNELVDMNLDWQQRQLAAGVPFHPEDHPKPGSDYNQHTAELEADGAALDERDAAAQEILARAHKGA